jgi:hypothetical protein
LGGGRKPTCRDHDNDSPRQLLHSILQFLKVAATSWSRPSSFSQIRRLFKRYYDESNFEE